MNQNTKNTLKDLMHVLIYICAIYTAWNFVSILILILG